MHTDQPLVLGARWARALMLLLPAIWLGLIIGISLIEAPLKFAAPGITIPLGLGIGRRVFFAMNLTEIAIAVMLIIALVALWRSHAVGISRGIRWMSICAVAVLAIKTVVIRPLLSARTDAVLTGESSGGSSTHYFYIAADFALIVLLVGLLVVGARRMLPRSSGVR